MPTSIYTYVQNISVGRGHNAPKMVVGKLRRRQKELKINNGHQENAALFPSRSFQRSEASTRGHFKVNTHLSVVYC